MDTYVRMENVSNGQKGEEEGVKIRSSRRASCLKLTVIVLIVLLTLTSALCIALGVLYGVNRDSSTSLSSDTCQSDACFDLSVRIQGAMNENTDPCEDFYNFTCGNWDIYNHITPGVQCISCVLMFPVIDDVKPHHEYTDDAACLSYRDIWYPCTIEIYLCALKYYTQQKMTLKKTFVM